MNDRCALIIEDDPQLGQIFSLTLQNAFHIEIIPDGAAAMERLGQVVPALLVLDLHLPGVSGAEIAARVRTDERLANTRVILCTADARQAETLHEVADIVLLKPVSPAQLRDLALRLCPA